MPKLNSQKGVTLIEISISIFIFGLLSVMAFQFYSSFHQKHIKQQQVKHLDNSINEAAEAINKYLRSCGAASNDSVFWDPNGVTTASGSVFKKIVNISPSNSKLTIFGNFTGNVAVLDSPVVSKASRKISVNHPSFFETGMPVYINGGSSQEVALITNINGSVLEVAHDLLAVYPIGTLAFPLFKAEIESNTEMLLIYRKTANDGMTKLRSFSPGITGTKSTEFEVTSYDYKNRRITYNLVMSLIPPGKISTKLERNTSQTVYLRGM